jgi:hypothetical protein
MINLCWEIYRSIISSQLNFPYRKIRYQNFLAFLIFGILTSTKKGPGKLSSYDSEIEPILSGFVTISNLLLYVFSNFCVCFK